MQQMRQSLAIAILAFCAGLVMTGSATAAPYNFGLKHFTVEGNLPGTASDDFDDGSLAPLWEIDDPTVVESGGVASFSGPGFNELFPLGSLQISSEMSYMSSISSGGLGMANGAGDFLGTSTWTATVPGINQLFTMGVGNEAADEDVTIGVYNFGQDVADFFGIPQGLGVFFGRFGDVGSGDFDAQGVAVLPGDITGDVLLSLAFSDDSNQYAGTFSLDGGASFLSPFSFVSSGADGQALDWYLGAESWEVTTVPIPASAWLLGAALLAFSRVRRRSIH